MGPYDQKTIVKSIEVNHKSVSLATAGEFIGVNIKMEKYNYRALDCGFVLSDLKQDPVRDTLSFIAQVVVIQKSQLKNGYCGTLFVHTARVPCKFFKIRSKIDRRT